MLVNTAARFVPTTPAAPIITTEMRAVINPSNWRPPQSHERSKPSQYIYSDTVEGRHRTSHAREMAPRDRTWRGIFHCQLVHGRTFARCSEGPLLLSISLGCTSEF